MVEAVVLILSYLIGSVPTAYLVTKWLTGKDPREEGSRNVGGLNTYRIVSKERGKALGLLAGAFVAVVDALKAVIAYLLATVYAPTTAFLAPMFAIFGHNYPVWLKFRGGRGIAALLGFFLFTNPVTFVLFLVLQGIVVAFTKRFAPGAMFSLLTSLPLAHVLGFPVLTSQALAELPVWLRYREKYILMREGKLEVGF